MGIRLKVNQVVDAVLGFIVFYLGSEHDFRRFTYLSNYVGKRIVRHFALNIKLFRNMVVFHQIVRQFVVEIVIHEFTISIGVDEVVFLGFETYLVEQFEQYGHGDFAAEYLLRHFTNVCVGCQKSKGVFIYWAILF